MTREWIKLTDQQRILLRPYIERVQTAKSLGSPGMLVAQFTWDEDGAWMIPAFLPHQKAIFLEEAGVTNIVGRRAPCAPGRCMFINYQVQDKRRKTVPPAAVCANCGKVKEAGG